MKYLEASNRCICQNNVSLANKQKFDRFDFANEDRVHNYVYCIWSSSQGLGWWNDRNGFGVQQIADLYKNQANTEILIPILNDCNRNDNNQSVKVWCYNSFICILNSQVGEWFKNDVSKAIRSQSNGHV